MKTNDYKIQGFDYCEFYVGNAKQTTHYYQTTMGFQVIAYRGLDHDKLSLETPSSSDNSEWFVLHSLHKIHNSRILEFYNRLFS